MKIQRNNINIIYCSIIVLLAPVNTLTRQLNIPWVGQKNPQWCWAAVSEMTLKYYGITKTQAQLATWVFGSEANLPLPLYNDANTNLGVNKVLKNFAGNLIGSQYYLNGTLSKQQIFTEIDNDRPIPILGETDVIGKYHIVEIIGYENDSPTNPSIWINDPNYTQSQKVSLKSVQETFPTWEWLETLRFQKSGINGTGVLDGVQISTNGVDFNYTEPAVARTYTGTFIRKYPSRAYAHQWHWALSFSHSLGNYIVSTYDDLRDSTLTSTWNAPSFVLPTNYSWNYTNDGAVIGKLILGGPDTDGYYHSDEEDVFYYPPNPYPMSISYAYTSVSNPSPDVKAHQVIVLRDYQINSGANISFRAGEAIVIRDNVTIQNGSLSNFIVDPAIR